MNILRCMLLGAAVFSVPAKADLLYGVYAEAGASFQKTDSTAESSSVSASVDGMRDSDVSPFLNFKIEHPVPLVPNFRFYLDSFDYSADLESANSDTIDFSSNEKVGTFYYEILDNYISVDLGLSIRQIKTDFSIQSTGIAKTDDLTVLLPTVYAAAEFAVPTTSFTLGAEYEGLSFDDNDYRLLRAYVAYELVDFVAADLSFKVGVISRDVVLGDLGGVDFNYKTDAVFSSVQVHF
ncbi:TIGR04219 family outer membrane beta-barrel protein [Pseudoalteromonas marina]|uniref:TIGR04219 family outer membrane beta-barrel protein n=1 Tax=Pseudoalteromonas marina TaxID=267375 RepID=A0ABT9FGJ5_9GAMM|nr:TIGR04219 family outer membrane beta-barrel protein [Pseudoalteromonas marina]MDP2565799.1 TIGR04219 family outer membrane beta-barrel protein [Pseudoalteromonas marina]